MLRVPNSTRHSTFSVQGVDGFNLLLLSCPKVVELKEEEVETSERKKQLKTRKGRKFKKI
jgi:hypothetical protein